MQWVSTPASDGWYWHRFFVDGKPVYNVCCVMIRDSGVFVHYLGEVEQQPMERSSGDMYCGPMQPPG